MKPKDADLQKDGGKASTKTWESGRSVPVIKNWFADTRDASESSKKQWFADDVD